MKKFLYLFFLSIIFLFFSIVIYLSSIGYETSKFNNLVIKEIKKKTPKVNLELEKIKIKIDIKKIQLFLSTNNPQITYQNIKIPIKEIKIFTKIDKLLNSKIEINQIIFVIEKFKIPDIQKLSTRIKPSNFKTYLLNNLYGGEIEKGLFDLNIDSDFNLVDYKANGSIKKINIVVKKNFEIKDISFNFKIDNNLSLINSIKASHKDINISNGSVEILREKDIEIKSKFNSDFNLNETQLNKIFKKIKFFKENKIKINGSLVHEFNLKMSDSFKITDYEYKSNGNILQSHLILQESFKSKFIERPIKKITLEKTKLEVNYNKKNNNLLILDGLYSTDNTNYKKFKFKNNLNQKELNYFIDLDLSENLFLDIINFKTNSKKKSNLKSEFIIKNNKFFFKSIDFTEGKSLISINGLILNKKKKIDKISNIKVITFNKDTEKNNFKINFSNNISIFGERYDAKNLLKLLSSDNNSNFLKNFTNKIEINLKNLSTKSNIPLSNFNLIGSIQKGKFVKISAKSEFSKDEYLDISLKKDLNGRTIVEVYSDLPQALLADYKFFEGINGGKLLYNSTISDTSSISKLVIENFKVSKAPAFATLLTLADLGGFADLLSGKGMSFDILEINLQDNLETTTVDEILALGSSVSLQMDGYIEKKTSLISLKGTLVPAKTLNRLVSKIPLVGKILIGDKVGEGVFGVSFKVKGLPGKTKTTVNPVKTITPRFILRALEKRKKK